MPTFSAKRISVTSHTLSTTLTLDEIRAALASKPPQSTGRAPGWTAITPNQQTVVVEGTPSSKAPEVWPEDTEQAFPERLAARYNWWTQLAPRDYDVADPAERPWLLDAVDVIINKVPTGFQILWSTQHSRLIDPPTPTYSGGTVAQALLNRLHAKDSTATLSASSVLAFANRELYLWLASAHDLQSDVSAGIKVHKITSMATNEGGMSRTIRSGLLDGTIDLERISFLSAIATGVELGPAVVAFSELHKKTKFMHTYVRFNTAGHFSPLVGECRFREPMSAFDIRLRAVQLAAYRYIPRAISGFAADGDWTKITRNALVISKQVQLSKEFRDLAQQNTGYADWVSSTGMADPFAS